MQQSVKHSEFINNILSDLILSDLIPEWVIQTKAQQVSIRRADMFEILTLTHEALTVFVAILANQHPSFKSYRIVPKYFNSDIIRWLHPITLVYWFMDDGSKESNRKLYSSKGIELHLQGFDMVSNKILANSLPLRYGWDVVLKAAAAGGIPHNTSTSTSVSTRGPGSYPYQPATPDEAP